jgi:putative nucleotidyltransferase with HDIG domain
MSGKRIMVADADESSSEHFRQALGDSWEVVSSNNGIDALSQIERQPCSVVVADLNLPEFDGPQLLNRVQEKYPKTARFVSIAEKDREKLIKRCGMTHPILARPFDPAKLRETIERAHIATPSATTQRVAQGAIGRIKVVPAFPEICAEIAEAMRSPKTAKREVAALVAADAEATARVLHIANSAVYGLTWQMSEPAEAVELVGLETVQAAVIAAKLLEECGRENPPDFSAEQLWQHNTEVARTARYLAMSHTADEARGQTAFAAGLMHDLGKAVLAANFGEEYHKILADTASRETPPWDAEKKAFGANHEEVGAYVLKQWGVAPEILEAVAFHHQPARSTTKGFTTLTAVHIANVMERGVNPDELATVPPRLDQEYVKQAGVADKINGWSDIVSNRTFDAAAESNGATNGNGASNSPPAKRTPPRIPAIVVGKMKSPAAAPATRTATNANAGVGFLRLFALANLFLLVLNGAGFAYLLYQFAHLKRAEVAGSVAVAPGEVRARTPRDAATGNLAQQKPRPDFKLQSIMFGSVPMAIINGKTVEPDDIVLGARVLEINEYTVVLLYNNERIVLRGKK